MGRARTPDEKFIFFDTAEACADAAVSVFAANHWSWSRVGIPEYDDILETLQYLKRTAEDEYCETGRLIYLKGRFGYERPKPRQMAETEITGRELDALVAERVMGWRTSTISQNVWYSETEHNSFHKESFRPSESIEAAMQVVDTLRARFPVTLWCDVDHFVVQIFESNEGHAQDVANISAMTLPEAICRAALAAIDSQKQAGGE